VSFFVFDDAKVSAIFYFAKFFWNFFRFFFTLQSLIIDYMKRILLIIFFVIGFCSVTFAQLETAVWYFGDKAGLDFNTPEPKILLDGALSNLEGVASFSDSLGNLLFYTDGRTVWNRNHKVMSNGANLVGHVSSTESAIIMPWPGSKTKYLLFVVDAEFGGHGLSYSIVDMTLDGGLGGITGKKNIPLEDVVCEKVTAIRHQNNRDFWLIARPVPGDVIVEYLVDPTGIVMSSRKTYHACSYSIQKNNVMYNPETAQYEYAYDPTMSIGYMRIAPNGRKIAVANGSASLRLAEGGDYINILDVLDFDPATGVIKPYVTYYDREAFLYGVEFSNDVSKLYFTSRRKIFQMDLALPSADDVLNSVVQVGEYPMLTNVDTSYAGALQLALNGRIYVAQRNYGYLGVIENPREAGKACNYVIDGQYLGGRQSLMGLPNFIPTYFLPPNFEITHNCGNEDVQFSCTDTRDIESLEWKLHDAEGKLLCTNSNSSFTYALDPGKYRITLTIKVMNVEHSDYRFFNVHEPPLLRLLPDTTICRGGYADILPERNDSCIFQWLGRDDAAIIRAVDAMSVVGQLTDINTGCISYDTVNVSVAEPEVFSLGPDISFCKGLSVSVSASVTGKIDLEKYRKWEWGDTLSGNPARVFGKPGTYTANAVDMHYCAVSDQIRVAENPLPAVDLGSDTILCANIARTLDCGVRDADYQWNTGATSQSISPSSAGKYHVTVTDRNGCVNSDTIKLVAKVLPEISLPADTVMCDGNAITLSVWWPDATQYVWEDFSQQNERIVQYTGNYRVDVTNVCGTVYDEIYIRYRYCGEFVFPNIITPNGDGINDYFRIKGLDEFTQGWHIDIYNREGRRVYSSDNYQNEWNAPDVSDGVYFYIFYRDTDRYKGNITVFHR